MDDQHEPDCITQSLRSEGAGDWDAFLGTGDWSIWEDWVAEMRGGEDPYRLATRIRAEVWDTVWLPCGCPQEMVAVSARLEDAIYTELVAWETR